MEHYQFHFIGQLEHGTTVEVKTILVDKGTQLDNRKKLLFSYFQRVNHERESLEEKVEP